ncbi:MAG: hypothetical protein GXP37_02920 [Chloroflexi bacterium]|nr:hypothetical protein [Chloroflexota bacterium]
MLRAKKHLWPPGGLSFVAVLAAALLLYALLLIAGQEVSANALVSTSVRYVDGAAGVDVGECQDPAHPCGSISYAISQTAVGDSILVAEGIYTENLDVGVPVSLTGGYEAGGWTRDLAQHETIIDGSGAASIPGDWDGRMVRKAAVINNGVEYMMWYDGVNLIGDDQIGVAYSLDGKTWIKAEGNPVLGPVPDTWESDPDAEFAPFVLKEGDVYKMWYEHARDGVRQLGYATSSDGLLWNRHSGNPVLTVGPDGFDQETVGHGTVLHEDGLYKLWYHAIGDQGVIIAYATSPDGVNWTKQGPVLYPEGGAWDQGGLWGPSVLKSGDTYWMWYSAFGPMGPPAIGVVTSTNGITWTRSLTAPVLSEDGAIGNPRVIDDGSTLRMWYTNMDEGVIKLAESTNGIDWTPVAENPALTPGASGRWGGPVVVFGGGSEGSTLDGFTITGGRGETAGGVKADVGDVTIRNCVIRDNFADGTPWSTGGGGVAGGDITIRDSFIINNNVRQGAGGVRSFGSQLTMVNTLVADNHGDAAIHANGSVSLMNVTIARNDGGVLFNPPGQALLDITNSIIWQNQWSITQDPPAPRVVTYSIVEGGWSGEGNLDTDPQFMDPDNGDYHLAPWSPAIDAGTATGAPDHDLDGVPRPHAHNALPDMGAYEYQGAPLANEGDRYVALSGTNDGPNLCLDPASPCATIGHAVQMAQNGETVWVTPGVFTENLEISAKDITIHGGYKMSDTLPALGGQQTVVNGSHSGRTFYIHDGSNVRLEAMRIINGVAPEEACWGGGVNVSNARVTIRHAYVTNNAALCSSGQSGGGAGAGLNAVSDEGPATLLVEDSFILDNQVGDHGSALGTDGVTVVFTNVVVSGNTQNVLAIHNTDFRMVNSTVAENDQDGNSILDFDSDANISVLNSILWHSGGVGCGQGGGNCDIRYTLVEGGWSGEGNLDADPLLIEPATEDFRLHGGSPAINAGTPNGAPATDILGNPRDTTPDMGAYEWQGSLIYLPLLQFPPAEGGINTLIGHWSGTLTGFYDVQAFAIGEQQRNAPFTVVFNTFVRAKGSENVYLGAGYAAVGAGAELAPMAAQAVDRGGNAYDVALRAASAVGGEVISLEMTGTMAVDAADHALHTASGVWRTVGRTGGWAGDHADTAGEQGKSVAEIAGFSIEGPLVTGVRDCDGAACRMSTDFDIFTNIPSVGAEVFSPAAAGIRLEPYSDIFSSSVDFVAEFRYSARIPGTPDSGAPYTFRLLDAAEEPIPGARQTESWSGCPIDPPRNHVATPPGGTATSFTLSWSAVANADNYQVEIGNDNDSYYGAVDVTNASHVIPWAGFGGDAPGSPDGQDVGQSLGELSEGEYRIQVGSRSADCFAADHSSELHFRKEGNTITFFVPGS